MVFYNPHQFPHHVHRLLFLLLTNNLAQENNILQIILEKQVLLLLQFHHVNKVTKVSVTIIMKSIIQYRYRMYHHLKMMNHSIYLIAIKK